MLTRGVTVFSPTMNRPQFVTTFVRSLAVGGFTGTYVCADSSDSERFEAAALEMQRHAGQFEIRHLHLPGASVAKCMDVVLPTVNTPFLCVTADDDIPVVRGMEAAVQTLHARADCSGVVGNTVHLTLGSDGRSVVDGNFSKGRGCEQDSACQRLQGLLSDYRVLLFSLMRREAFALGLGASMDRGGFVGGEVLPVINLAVQGKVAWVDELMFIRQLQTGHRNFDLFDTLLSPGWGQAVFAMIGIVAAEIARIDAISEDAARAEVKKWIWRWYADDLDRVWGNIYQPKTRSSLAVASARVQLLRRLVRALRRRLGRSGTGYTLQSLVSPEFRHAAQLRPILQILGVL